jgi:heterogeneous nuclear ribonucleoprotein F/H
LIDCSIIGGKDGVHFVRNKFGYPTGAYLQFATEADYKQALAKNRQHMGDRYIEGMVCSGHIMSVIFLILFAVFESSRTEIEYLAKQKMQRDTVVKLLNLPYDCELEDITNFFSGQYFYDSVFPSFSIIMYDHVL